jgi:triacylglycerol lipase
MKTLVLAHGVLGFGDLIGGFSPVNYFNGVAAHLEQQGHKVIAPQVNPIGSVQARGEQLAAAVARELDGISGIHIIAHSMGGLDARHALAHVPGFAGRIATLVTIGTPHRGSPVADAIVSGTGPLFAHIPTFLLQQLQRNAGALHDLTTAVCVGFDESTPDSNGVQYIEVAGDASQGGHELWLFQLAAVIGRLTGEVNDGVVARSSALRAGHEHLDDWPVDHAGEVGWSFASPLPVEVELPLIPQPPHFARYDAIVAGL